VLCFPTSRLAVLSLADPKFVKHLSCTSTSSARHYRNDFELHVLSGEASLIVSAWSQFPVKYARHSRPVVPSSLPAVHASLVQARVMVFMRLWLLCTLRSYKHV
jgi:hypothetical protein